MSVKSLKSLFTPIALIAFGIGGYVSMGDKAVAQSLPPVPASACSASLNYLTAQYSSDPEVRAALGAVVAGMQDTPAGTPGGNPWKTAKNSDELLGQLVSTFTDWCEFLPQINGSHDDGLYYIKKFSWFYYKNPAAMAFIQGHNPLDLSKKMDVGRKFTKDFTLQRGEYMWSPASTKHIAQWVSDPRIEIKDFEIIDPKAYTSFNDFFARHIITDVKTQTIPSRPTTMPDLDYIVVSPTDCIMNPLVQVLAHDGTVTRKFIENPLQNNTILDVKGIPVSVDKLLGNASADLKKHFVGGTGMSCILMPNTYHHFHAPVNGTVLHAEVVENNTYGYLDFPNWAPSSGNVGQLGTDFSQFEVFQRGVVIIEVKYADADGTMLTGYVASIPVGLDTIGSVVLNKDIIPDPKTNPAPKLKRGYTRIGNFLYGGSMNMLLFSKGLAGGVVKTRLGNQINMFNNGNIKSIKP